MSITPESPPARPPEAVTGPARADACLRLQDFDYALPEELIAQHPAAERSASRLLHVRANGALLDLQVRDLAGFLDAGDLLVFNDTRVMKARLHGRKDTGGQVEILVERVVGTDQALAQIRASHAPKAGAAIVLADGTVLRVQGREGEFFQLQVPAGEDFAGVLERVGRLPLPPYITRADQAPDETRYQTVYAAHPGAVAAPTAGLHFDDALMQDLRARGIGTAFLTLHVGAGTFQPVRVDNLDEHRMHSERYTVPESLVAQVERTRAAGGRVVAVGTTSLRALESAARSGVLCAGAGETALFIRPGYRFRVVDRLMTNFHLPRSTLLMLVSAFAGYGPILRAYQHAVRERYRFFSYGDAMLLEREARGGE